MLEVRNLLARGVAVDALDVERGECVAVRGPSGAGKTVMLRALADLDPCTGEVSLDGESWRAMSAPQWRRRVVLVPAEPGWWSEIAIDHFRQPDGVRAMLPEVALDPGVLTTPVTRLSTGERQRLALLRALELAPRALLLDEPTSAVDEETGLAVEQVLRAHMGAGMSVVLVTHDRDQAARLAARQHLLRNGRLSESSSS